MTWLRWYPRQTIEHWLLVASINTRPYREQTCRQLTTADFTTARHRAVYQALPKLNAVVDGYPDLRLARILGEHPDQFHAWCADAAPTHYEACLALLLEWRNEAAA